MIGAAAKENGQLTATHHWAKPLPTLAPGMDAATATRSCPTWRRPRELGLGFWELEFSLSVSGIPLKLPGLSETL